MTRRGFFGLPAAALLPGAPAAQTAAGEAPDRDYHGVLPAYLRALAERAYRTRSLELAKLGSAAAVRERGRWARETLWLIIGGRPAPTPLNARAAGGFERDGYRVEKVIYESRPRLFIPALLYVPARAHAPFPAVLFQCGHAASGKAYPPYQRCCQGLARLGFLVLAFDPMGQGERVYYPDSSGAHSRLPSADDEHTLPGRQMLLVGDTATRLQLWDAVRSLDYLAGHPLADPKRLAAAGHSGGGTLTMLLAAVDDRLAAAVVSSGNTENFCCAGFNPPGSTDDAEQNLIGSAGAGFDRWDTLYPFAPRPLLISVSERDASGVYSPSYLASGREEFARLKRAYAQMSAGDRLEWISTPLPHDLAYDTRLKLYHWFARWLQEGRRIAEEPPTAPEQESALWTTAHGSVTHELNGETPLSLARARIGRRTPASLERLLRLERPPAGAAFSVLRRAGWRAIDIQAAEALSSGGVRLPAWLFVPKAGLDTTRPALLALNPAGRSRYGREGELYPELAARGVPVCSADVRGTGDVTPEFGRGNPAYTRDHEAEEAYAWASLILGRPLAGQRVADILALAEAWRAHPAARGRRLRVAASGRLTVPALLAAALDPSIDALYLGGPLVSFASILAVEEYGAAFANFVPSILLHTDLPEIAAGIAPRPVVLAGAVNAEGDTMDPNAVHKLYGGAGNVVVRPKAEWNEAVLAAAL